MIDISAPFRFVVRNAKLTVFAKAIVVLIGRMSYSPSESNVDLSKSKATLLIGALFAK
jgi:hypothetical protein